MIGSLVEMKCGEVMKRLVVESVSADCIHGININNQPDYVFTSMVDGGIRIVDDESDEFMDFKVQQATAICDGLIKDAAKKLGDALISIMDYGPYEEEDIIEDIVSGARKRMEEVYAERSK
jgi:regulator of sirC expression with transglutaminase-like and TPR domain